MRYERVKKFVQEWADSINEELYSFLKEKEKRVKEYGEINEKALEYSIRLIKSGGKRIRPLLVLLGYKGIKGRIDDEVVKVGATIELLHTFLIIHDDICDRDPLRRGVSTLWKTFYDELREKDLEDPLHIANSLAMIEGDVLYTYVYQMLQDLEADGKEKVLRKLLDVVELTGYGEMLDIYLGTLPIGEVREEDVLKVYLLKTGVYSVSGPLDIGATLAGREGVFKVFGENAGIAFQIHDDIIGVFGEESVTGKPVGSDIREGKRTILVVRAYQNSDEYGRRKIESVLGRENASQEEVEEVVDIIRETGALDYARSLERRLIEEGVEYLEKLDIEEDTKEILRELAFYVIEREK